MALPEEQKTLTTASPDEEAPAAAKEPALVVVLCGANPGLGGLVLPLNGAARVHLRRGADAEFRAQRKGERVLQLSIPDAKISGDHGHLDVHRDRLVIHDAGSTNGWKVRGARVTGPTALPPGEAVVVGDTLLTFSPDAARGGQAWPFPTAHPALAGDLRKLEILAPAPVSIVLQGETGVGKEVVARAIHERSGQPGAFVAVNCAALPAGLVEAQLFGHKRGAFSGAVQDAPGFFQAAHQGTLLLDEVGDLPPPAQAALLRALQQGEVVPVGAVKPVPVQVRVLSATHKPLDRLVQAGQFRADLYARLRGHVIELPPLRERRCDLGFIVAAIARKHGIEPRLSGEAVAELYRRPHPFNLREVEQSLVAASYLAQGARIRPEHLPAPGHEADEAAAEAPAEPLSDDDQRLVDELRRRLAERGGNITRVAEDMGKARQQVQRWLKRFKIEA